MARSTTSFDIEIGKAYGPRTVIFEAEPYQRPNGYTDRRWLCRCKCGHERKLSAEVIMKQRTCQRCSNKAKTKEASLINRVVSNYRANARKRGLVWGLSHGEALALMASSCHYCGAVPNNFSKSYTTPASDPQLEKGAFYSGLDRLDNSKGYEPGNVVSCCKPCNWAKGKKTYGQFVAWLDQLGSFRALHSFSADRLAPLNELRDIVARNAINKGFRAQMTEGLTPEQVAGPIGQLIYAAVFSANQHGETSEFWEAFRAGTLHKPCDKAKKMEALGLPGLTCAEEEIADEIIRALDKAHAFKVDVAKAIATKHAYNLTRPALHGGKLA